MKIAYLFICVVQEFYTHMCIQPPLPPLQPHCSGGSRWTFAYFPAAMTYHTSTAANHVLIACTGQDR